MPAGPHSVDKAMLDGLVGRICRLGLGVPASAFLDAGRPLALLVSQLLWIVEPTANAIEPDNQISAWATLLEHPETMTYLLARLEDETDR